MTIRVVIRLLRQSGMSNRQIARAIGTTWRTVPRWAHGHNEPIPIFRDALIRLAESRGIDVSNVERN